jgi:hypothetical protein
VSANQSKDAAFSGDWRIVEMEVWNAGALDLVEPARLSVEPGGAGSLVFIAIGAGIDHRVEERDGGPRLEFSWDGVSEGDPISGRGWAVLHGDELRGRLYIHLGDESSFVARRMDPA